LVSTTDETSDFSTLKDRFDTYYDHVRKVARELEERCEKYSFPPYPPLNGTVSEFGGWFRHLFSPMTGRKKGKAPRAGRGV
jgi:hypothetical protein